MQDQALVLSEKQAITSSAASQNIINEEVAFNTGTPMIAEVRVNTAFSGTGNLTVAIEASDTSAFTSKEVLATSPAIAASKLTVGKAIRIPIAYNANKKNCYIRAYYTASAAFTAGEVTTVIQPRVQTNMED